jgi:hypothetical protein
MNLVGTPGGGVVRHMADFKRYHPYPCDEAPVDGECPGHASAIEDTDGPEWIKPFSTLEVALEDRGYKRGAISDRAAKMDIKIATADPCPKCGGHMTYIPLTRVETARESSYRAFAVCRHDDLALEF